MRRPRSKIQCAGLPSRAASGGSSSERSKRRWTLTIGESSSGGGGSPSSDAASAGGTATDERVGGDSLAVGQSQPHRARARRPASGPSPSPLPPRAPGLPRRRASPRAERRGAARSLAARSARRAVCTVKSPSEALASSARQVERRADEDVPEAVDRALGSSPSRRSRRPNVSPSCDVGSEPPEAGRDHGQREGARRARRCRYRSSGSAPGAERPDSPALVDHGQLEPQRACIEPVCPIRSRKRRYSVQQPRATCWPLSGGGGGSPSRSGRVWTAPPRVGRASSRRHVVRRRRRRSSAAASPARPPPITTTLSRHRAVSHDGLGRLAQDPAADDPQLAEGGEAGPRREDVVAAPLDLVQQSDVDSRRELPARKGRWGSRAAAEARSPSASSARAREAWWAMSARHSGRCRPAARSSSSTPNRASSSSGRYTRPSAQSSRDIAHDVDLLQGHAERFRQRPSPLGLRRARTPPCTRSRSVPATRRQYSRSSSHVRVARSVDVPERSVEKLEGRAAFGTG